SLLEILEKHRSSLSSYSILTAMLRDVDAISAEIKSIESSFQSEDCGKHLMAVDDLVQKHSLSESQMVVMGETMKRLERQAKQFVATGHREAPLLQTRVATLLADYEALLKLGKARRAKLEES